MFPKKVQTTFLFKWTSHVVYNLYSCSLNALNAYRIESTSKDRFPMLMATLELGFSFRWTIQHTIYCLKINDETFPLAESLFLQPGHAVLFSLYFNTSCTSRCPESSNSTAEGQLNRVLRESGSVSLGRLIQDPNQTDFMLFHITHFFSQYLMLQFFH